MFVILVFLLLLVITISVANFINIRFFAIFFIVNLTVIVDLVFGGFITKIALGESFVQPYVDTFILSTIFFPSLLFFFLYIIFNRNRFHNGHFLKSDFENFENWLLIIFSYSKFIFIICSIILISIMLSTGFIFRNLYRYIIETNLGFILTLTYTSGLSLFFYYMLKKKYLYSIVILIFLSTLGKKHPVIYALLIPYIYSLFKSPKLNFFHFIFPSLLVVFFAYFAIFLTDGLDISIVEQLGSSFDYYLNFNYFVQTYDLGVDKGNIFFSSFYKIIPRFIWQDKPTVYGFLLIHDKIFYNEMLIDYYPSVFEEFAEPMADFGWYLGWVIIVLKKLITYFFLFFKKINFNIRMLLMLSFLDLFFAIYIFTFSLLFFKKNK